MSYVINKRGHVDVDFKAAKAGSYTKTVDLDFEIVIDTDSYDQQVEACNSSIRQLTGSVVATEAAQVASITKNANRVANTIVDLNSAITKPNPVFCLFAPTR